MRNLTDQFQNSYLKFKQEEANLPQSISWKLNIIHSLHQGNVIQKQLLSEQKQMQLEDLQDTNKKGLMLIFNSIIKTLFVNEVVIDKVCSIKKNGLLKCWIKSYINFQEQSLCLNYKNKTVRYSFGTLQVKRHSDRKCFQIYNKGHYIMVVKFQKQESCKAAIVKIQKSIIQKKNQLEIGKFQSYTNLSFNEAQKIDLFSPNISRVNNSKSLSKAQLAKINKWSEVKIQKRYLPRSPQKANQFAFSPKFQVRQKVIPQQTLSSISIFHQLKYKSQNIQISQDSRKPLIHVEMILKITEPIQKILCKFILQKQWNQNITEQNMIINEQSHKNNKICVKRIFKSVQNQKQRSVMTSFKFKKLGEQFAVMNEYSINLKTQEDQKTIRTCLQTNYFIECDNNFSKLTFQTQINQQVKTQIQNEGLRQILFQMYKNVIYFQQLFDKVKNKKLSEQNQRQILNFLYQNQQPLAQYDDSTGSSDQNLQQISDKVKLKIRQSDSTQDQQKRRRDQVKSIYQTQGPQFIPLESPLKIPSKEYLIQIQNKSFQIDFFKHFFSQQNTKVFDQYAPWYSLKQLVKANYYIVSDTKQLQCTCWELIQSQKDTLRFVLKQIGANIISGKSILNVSLPIDIFQSRTLLERSASSYGLAPDLLIEASNMTVVQQMKRVTAFLANATSCQLIMQKPFNPILGQTFQGYLKGIPIYYEQTFHSPPISSYFMKCEQFTMYGNLVPYADMGLNTAIGGNSGAMHILFPNGTHFECYFPPVQIAGIIYGKRKFRSYGKGFVIERSHNLLSQFSIQKQKKGIYESKQKLYAGSVIGGIFKVKSQFWDFVKPHLINMKKFPGITKDYICQKYSQTSGVWYGQIYVDGAWVNKNAKLYPVQYAKSVLPSDANYRLDVLYHKMNNLPQSQKQKQILQNVQRNDRKLREKYSHSKK